MWTETSNVTALDKLWDGMNVNTGVIQLPKDAHLGDKPLSAYLPLSLTIISRACP